MIPCGFLAMLTAISLIPYSAIIRKKIRNGEITADGVMATAGGPSTAPVQSFKEDTWVCPNYGAECDDKSKFCMKCRTKKPE